MRQRRDKINLKRLVGIAIILFVPLMLSSCAAWQTVKNIAGTGTPWYKAYGFESEKEMLTIASVPVLIDALGDQRPEVRVEAAGVLAEIGPDAKDAVPALIEVAGDEDFAVRQAAADALEIIELKSKSVFFEEEKEQKNKIKLVVYTVRLESPDWMVKREAVNQLAAMGKVAAPAVPDLIRVLEDRSDWYRHYNEVLRGAATALGNIGPAAQPATPALIELMENKDYDVRLEVVKALGKIGPSTDSAIIGALVDAVHGDPDFMDVRHSLAGLLPSSWEYMAYKGILYGDPDFDVRREAAASLGGFEAAAVSAVPALLDATLTDIDFDVRRESAQSLYRIEPRGEAVLIVLDRTIEDKKPAVREAAMKQLIDIRPDVRESWVPRILVHLDDIDEGVRMNAVKALAEYKITNDMVYKALKRVALEDKSLKVKNEAVKTMFLLGLDSPPAE